MRSFTTCAHFGQAPPQVSKQHSIPFKTRHKTFPHPLGSPQQVSNPSANSLRILPKMCLETADYLLYMWINPGGETQRWLPAPATHCSIIQVQMKKKKNVYSRSQSSALVQRRRLRWMSDSSGCVAPQTPSLVRMSSGAASSLKTSMWGERQQPIRGENSPPLLLSLILPLLSCFQFNFHFPFSI